MVYQTIMELTENINVFPEKYPVEKSFGDSTIRFIPKWNFKIVYQIQTDKILVVNIYSTRQNPKKLKP
jgi:toxin ParE1/3/4